MFSKQEMEVILVAIARASWNGQEVETIAYLKQKINEEVKKLESPVEEIGEPPVGTGKAPKEK